MTFILPTVNLTGLLVAFVPCVLIGLAMMWMDKRSNG